MKYRIFDEGSKCFVRKSDRIVFCVFDRNVLYFDTLASSYINMAT